MKAHAAEGLCITARTNATRSLSYASVSLPPKAYCVPEHSLYFRFEVALQSTRLI